MKWIAERNYKEVASVAVPRMRTIAEAHKMLKELDPDTAITISRIRKMVKIMM